MTKEIESVLEHFKVFGVFEHQCYHGNGLIHDTFKITTNHNGTKHYYLLQRFNNGVFKHIEQVMHNVSVVLDTLHDELIKNGKDPLVESLTIVNTIDETSYYYDADKNTFWRMFVFIHNGISYDSVDSNDIFEETGVAFGRFQQMLDGLDPSNLYETIPNFHHTQKRYESFEEAVKTDKMDRAKLVQPEINFFLNRKHYAPIVTDLMNKGLIPTRITHNDTKLDNVLINPDSGKSVCVIDLDTVMPGSLLYDFGDAIRYGANHNTEDETDLSKVNFDITLFEAFTKGFVSQVNGALTQYEKEYLAFSSILITFELGMRFLSDYLNGDLYFKTKRPNHNLDRTRVQMKLIEDMEHYFPTMKEIVIKYTENNKTAH